MLASGMTLIAVCKRPGMPHERTVRDWVLDLDHEFYPLYTRARQLGYEHMADETIEISDDSSRDYVTKETEGEDGSVKVAIVANTEHINRSRLRIDTRKWLLSKVLPKIYGDRLHAAPEPAQLHQQNVQVLVGGEDHLAGVAQRFLGGLKQATKTIEGK